MERVDILGVKISKVSYEPAIKIIEGFLTDGRKHYVVTPNPEFVVLAQSDRQFCKILNQADLAIPDGVGLRMGIKVTGTELMIKLCGLAARKGYSVFLLGGRGGVAEEAAKRLKKRFANLNVVGTCEADPEDALCAFRTVLSSARGGLNSQIEIGSQPPLSSPANADLSESQSQTRFASEIASESTVLQAESAVDLLFVAYGAPKQEKWIAENLSQIPVRVAMGVGGAFDFIAGKRKRAPKILRRLGLEWFWRLIQEPQRFPRILNATIKFPLLVFLHKQKSPGGSRNFQRGR